MTIPMMWSVHYPVEGSADIDFVNEMNVKHVSAYMLKIEEGTAFQQIKDKLPLPDEDEVCDLYLYAVTELEKKGYLQYEISNFSKKSFESRHNLKYWRCEEYLGIGPSAHSFVDGKRFFFERNFESFLTGTPPIPDGDGGNEEEYIMLALRLTEGLQKEKFNERFGKNIDEKLIKKSLILQREGLVTVTEDRISLTSKGFLVSNSIISYLLD